MLTWIREKFGTVIISLIIGFIAFVFIFYGVFSPKATRGLHDGAVAAKVNGDSITLQEFQRSVQQRMEMFKGMGEAFGQSKEQMRFVRMGVMEGLTRRKLILQETERQGMQASDAEVKARILEIPAFQKDGRFDIVSYKQTLQANGYTPASFERAVREDLSVERWEGFFKDHVQVSTEEAKQQFELSETQREVKYVLLTTDSGKKGVTISDAEIEKYLADAAKLNVVKNRFESQKNTVFKGKEFEAAKKEIVKDILSGEMLDQIRKINDELADKVVAMMKTTPSTADSPKDKDPKAKKPAKVVAAADAKVNELLKAYGVEVKSTGWISELHPQIGPVSDAKELIRDVFSKESPLIGKAKKYQSGPWLIVALVNAAKNPDLGKFDSEKAKITEQLVSQKERELSEATYKKLKEKAKIDINQSVMGSMTEDES